MVEKHLTRDDLQGKVIDAHSHVGVAIKEYCSEEYPYAQTAEGLYYQQLAGGVDVNIVFPFSADLYFEPTKLRAGEKIPAREPLSKSPYQVENRVLLREVFDYRPWRANRFVPFVSVDPGRDVSGQLAELEDLEKKFPIYGIKVIPVGCQSRALELLGQGEPFLDFAQEMVAFYNVLLLQGLACLITEANGAVIEHQLKLLGGGCHSLHLQILVGVVELDIIHGKAILRGIVQRQ